MNVLQTIEQFIAQTKRTIEGYLSVERKNILIVFVLSHLSQTIWRFN